MPYALFKLNNNKKKRFFFFFGGGEGVINNISFSLFIIKIESKNKLNPMTTLLKWCYDSSNNGVCKVFLNGNGIIIWLFINKEWDWTNRAGTQLVMKLE